MRSQARLEFFALGLAISSVVWLIELRWLDIARTLIDPMIVYDTRPVWLHIALEGLKALPLLVLAVLVVVRLSGNRGVRPIAFALGAACLWAAVLAQAFVWPGVSERLYATHFDSRSWIENGGQNSDWPARLRMVDDLLETHELQGLSRAELESLLGPADETGYFRKWDLVYWLGPERGWIRIDSEWLVLRLDGKGRVSEYQLARD